MGIPFIDMHTMPEDERIRYIGEIATSKITAVMLEKNEPAKIKRYIDKVTKRFSRVRHIDTKDVPETENLVVMVRFGPKGN